MFFYFISLFSEIRCYILIISDIIKDIEKITFYITGYCNRICILDVLRNESHFLCSS